MTITKTERRAMEAGANLIEHEDGWHWNLEHTIGAGPFWTSLAAARDYLEKVGSEANHFAGAGNIIEGPSR